MRSQNLIASTLVALAGASSAALADNTSVTPKPAGLTEWTMDPAHTQVGFSVSHLVVSEVTGRFKTWSGKVLLDENDPTRSALELSIDVASIDTGVPDRDKHLRSSDFFDAEKQPTITFKSTRISRAGKRYAITGDLTIRGVTKQVKLDATLSDAVTSPWGKQVRGAKITGKLNRQEFGVSWNKALDKGGFAVGDVVVIEVTTELNR